MIEAALQRLALQYHLSPSTLDAFLRIVRAQNDARKQIITN